MRVGYSCQYIYYELLIMLIGYFVLFSAMLLLLHSTVYMWRTEFSAINPFTIVPTEFIDNSRYKHNSQYKKSLLCYTRINTYVLVERKNATQRRTKVHP